ncbi:hypothetical protein GE061_004045 [Apolygus lucorum]|uniref:RING-CH-type domain-containing protein n=1 Tax=Apolygus lucorum TaxID=248454 RepID=A0A8S9WY37_APOLU|nr:hypothetical protein GE061_004045 [Apolygus lucorum]
MFNMLEMAAYLPKLEKLASSLTEIEVNEGRASPAAKSSRRRSSRKKSKTSKKIVLVKKPTLPETMPVASVVPQYPQFPQPGMVYVPASWIKKIPSKSPKKRKSVDFSEKHTMASMAKRRHTVVEQNILLQHNPGKNNKTTKKKPMLKDNPEKPSMDLAMRVSAKKAAMALERKRLEFLQYLQEVQEEISALEFASGQKLAKIRLNNKSRQKRDAVAIKAKVKKGTADPLQKPPVKSKNKAAGTPKKKSYKVDHPKNTVKPATSKVIKSKQSLTSMLSQESSSMTQIKMMDDAFNSNHRNYKASMNESKQTRLNIAASILKETNEATIKPKQRVINCGEMEQRQQRATQSRNSDDWGKIVVTDQPGLSSGTTVHPKSAKVNKLGEGDKLKSTIESTINSPARCPSVEMDDRESTLNLMSETLMSVADKLEKVFNNPKKRRPVSRPTIKRVYVIKFDEKGSQTSKHLRKSLERNVQNTKETDNKKDKMRSSRENPTDYIKNDSSSNINLNHFQNAPKVLSNGDDRSENDLSRPFKDRTEPTNDCSVPELKRQNKSFETDNSISYLINDVTSSAKKPRHKPFEVLEREKTPSRNRIPEIFNAILKEIGSIRLKNQETSERRRPRESKIKTLAEVLESEESLITAEYTIPRSMIKKEAVDRLQTLLDRLNEKSPVAPHIQTDFQKERSVGSEEVFEWKELPTTMSYYTTVINDPSNIDSSSSMLSGPICRICHGRHGTLVKPCRCRGTLAYVHVECLQVWLTEKEVNFCELCNYTFKVIHVPEYKIIPSIGFWYKFAATNHQKRTIMVDLTLGIVLIPFLIFLTMFVRSVTCDEKTEFDEDDEFEDNVMWHFGQATLQVATFLVILSYIAGVLVRINHHLSTWFTWVIRNLKEQERSATSEDGNSPRFGFFWASVKRGRTPPFYRSSELDEVGCKARRLVAIYHLPFCAWMKSAFQTIEIRQPKPYANLSLESTLTLQRISRKTSQSTGDKYYLY